MIVLSPKRVTLVLLLIAIALAGLGVLRDVYLQLSGTRLKYSSIFSFSDRVNIPTWYAASLLLLCAVLLLAIAWSQQPSDRFRYHWGGLAVIFFALSIDEVAELNLKFKKFLFIASNYQDIKYILLGLALAAIAFFAIFYRQFMLHLPRNMLASLGLTASLYIMAAITDRFDKRDAWNHVETYGTWRSGGSVLTTVDESLELLGIIVLVYALLTYMSTYIKELNIQFRSR